MTSLKNKLYLAMSRATTSKLTNEQNEIHQSVIADNYSCPGEVYPKQTSPTNIITKSTSKTEQSHNIIC